ncbi:hypothetical protein LCGC14_0998480 [marine sediment metagenome]|uniref:Uncharacterized protein n=1 Tax=marine sediment metagenome TaxID=412755 RepID=A0A0F9N8F5_9ZZZZ
MTKELTLRKISKLVSKIDDAIRERSRDIYENIVTTVVIHDPISDMIKTVVGANEDWDEALMEVLRLIGLRVTLRGALGSANQSAGINHLVTELCGLEQKLNLSRQIQRSAPKETQLTVDVLKRRMEARREAQTNATIDVSGYGRQNAEVTSDLPVLGKHNIVYLELMETQMKDQIEATHDKLEHLNSTVAIELPDDVVEELQSLNILS